MDLNINNLSIGFSGEGLANYKQELQISLLENTSEALNKTENVIAALDSGWSGQAKERFKEQLDASIVEIISDLQKEYSDLEAKFSQLEQSYYEQDQEMLNSI